MKIKLLSMKTIDDLIAKNGSVEFKDQVLPRCPFCNTNFLPGEVRRVECGYCNGNVVNAERLGATVDAWLATAPGLEELRKYDGVFAGYWDFEVSRRIRHIENRLQGESE